MDILDIKIRDNSVNAREVYDFIFQDRDNKTSFSHWFNRVINRYEFKEDKDFKSFLTKTIKGRPRIDYAVTLDMAKELAMISPTEKGKEARAYFLKCESIAKEAYVNFKIVRLTGVETRKKLADAIQESGENERMHGKGYSNFTRLAYTLTGVIDKYNDRKDKDGFRDSLTADELERVELAESLIKPMLKLNKQYTEIKKSLVPLFEPTEIKGGNND